ncbi:hypothetical protein [Janthinobacterium sp.]|uniref:hypothetical protein n=1 Tax=Janthinobacterium sp. TaxID=1871054 RepID=UPI0025B84313|nr:hypothetical protein [Janthinobacterium sp.]
MSFLDFISFFFNFQPPSFGFLGRTSLHENVPTDPSAHNIFKMLDDQFGTYDEVSHDPMVYFIWVSTPSGHRLPVIFSEQQWKMIHEVATMSGTSVEDVIVDVTKERYSS